MSEDKADNWNEEANGKPDSVAPPARRRAGRVRGQQGAGAARGVGTRAQTAQARLVVVGLVLGVVPLVLFVLATCEMFPGEGGVVPKIRP